uniref:Putative juvenile hormone binding protein in insects n=1 Tax=Haematobia irritans TaxID=7368 RepID=A0A1L8EG06_HAEIR
MRFLLVLAFATVALAGTVRMGQPMSDKIDTYVLDLIENNGEIDVAVDHEEGTVEIAPQFILSWQVRRFIRKFQKQMPCGFPQYGIPPLAPLKLREGEVSLDLGALRTFDKVYRFLLQGLDKFKINKFKLNIITSKITFDFLFQDINASATKYETDTILDLLQQLCLSVQYEGDGFLEFGLKNLRIAGVLKYKIPILWGSIKITSLKTEISLEQCTSDITGLLGDGSLNKMINRQIENLVVSGINNNSQEISDFIEDNLVPKVNKILKGNDFWTLIDIIFSSTEGESEDDPIVTKCVPPSDPWA